MVDPLIGVAPTRRMVGLSTSLDPAVMLASGVRALTVLPLSVVMRKRWDSDAHLTLYTVPDERAWPRLTKPSLRTLKAAGVVPMVSVVGVDVDNPGHADWTPKLAEDFLTASISAIGHAPWLGDWRYFYATRHGARFVYVLDRPAPPAQAEDIIFGVVSTWTRHGVAADPACADWTRIFRLPHVLRDGSPTWEDDLPFELEEQDGAFLETALVKRTPKKASPAPTSPHAAGPVDREKPTPHDVRRLLWRLNRTTGREVHTTFWKNAQKWLKGRDCYPCIFEGAPLALPGFRNSRIQVLVGGAVGMLCGHRRGVTPEHIYALFFEPAADLQPDDGTDDWTDIVWAAVCKYWNQEIEKLHGDDSAAEKVAAETLSIQTRMIRGAREWAPNVASLKADDRTAFGWLARRFIVTTPSGSCHLLKGDGYYDKLGVRVPQLHARIRQLGLETVYPVTTTDARGGTRKTPPASMVDSHGCCVSQVEGIAGGKGSYLEHAESDLPALKLRLYGRRTDIAPQYNEQVDTWLKAFFGDDIEKANAWIGHALAFEDGPICALSYKGYPGAGKKMFVQGFAECLDTGMVADSKEFGNFQHFLMRTPFLVVNEGWPAETAAKAQTRADVFRHYVSGDPIVAEEKYQPRVVLRTPLRIIMTANSLQVIRAIFSARDMTPEDRAALAIRVFHVDAGRAAPQHLRVSGGRLYTHGWISSDAHGSDGDATVAKHFLWLHENRPAVPHGNRLLVEGRMPQHLLRAMATGSGRSPMVVETLLYMIDSRKYAGAVLTQGGLIATTPQAVVECWRRQFATHTTRSITVKSVSATLESLSTKIKTGVLQTPNGSQKARWRYVNLPLLLEEATEMGYPCEKLLDIICTYEVWSEYREQAQEGKVIRVRGMFKKRSG